MWLSYTKNHSGNRDECWNCVRPQWADFNWWIWLPASHIINDKSSTVYSTSNSRGFVTVQESPSYLLVLYGNPSTNGANKVNPYDISGLWPCSLVRLREAKECVKVRESDHSQGLIKRQARSQLNDYFPQGILSNELNEPLPLVFGPRLLSTESSDN